MRYVLLRASLMLLLIVGLGRPGAASAQIVWDAPALLRPGAPSGLSVMLFDPHPGGDLGVLAAWRSRPAPAGLGLRAGLADDAGGDLAVMFGVDLSGSLGSLGSGGRGQPDVLWWTGAGMGIGNELVASFPLGLALGWQITDEGVSFAPYVGGHAVLDLSSGPGDDSDLDAAVDLGVDLGFGSGLMARFGASLGGRDAFGIGVRIPG